MKQNNNLAIPSRLSTKSLLAYSAALSCALSAQASTSGLVSTDRFGYTGAVVRYATEADALAGINAVGTTLVGNRDLSLYVVDDAATYDTDANIIMGSWWYTTDPSGSAGYGNTRGNSGVGFMQIYDADGSTDLATSFNFSNFDGTYWTQFDLSLSGENATAPADSTRFWVDYQGGGADRVNYLNYSLNLTATGLQGTQTGGFIEANGEPANVTGTFHALFQNVSTTYPQNNGFYVVDLNLDMVNWAYENKDILTGAYPFATSLFVASTPDSGATCALFGLSLAVLPCLRRRRA